MKSGCALSTGVKGVKYKAAARTRNIMDSGARTGRPVLLVLVSVVVVLVVAASIVSYYATNDNAKVFTTEGPQGFAYLSIYAICGEPSGYMPCFGGSPYEFSCVSAAETAQGCTQVVTDRNTSYTINIQFTNSSSTGAFDCRWTVPGLAVDGTEAAYCYVLSTNDFVLAEVPPPIVTATA